MGFERSVCDNDIPISDLAEQSLFMGHPNKWEEHVIYACPCDSRQCLLESWAMNEELNPLNRELGTHFIPTNEAHWPLHLPLARFSTDCRRMSVSLGVKQFQGGHW